MARRLLQAGFQLSIWNRSAGKTAELAELGARSATSASDVAASASIIFMCVTDAAAVEDIVFGQAGLAKTPGPGKLVVDFSSINPDATRTIAARLKSINGMGWIDAPVSGGTKGAEEGTLAVMAGGDAADIERVRPYVLAMARRLTHMGPTGAGQITKLCNQVIAGCAMIVLAEATRLAANAGIDAGRLPEALAGGFADSIPLQLFVPRMVQGIHSPPLGHIATILKDLDTVVEVARKTSTAVAHDIACRAIVQTGGISAWRRRRRARGLQAVRSATPLSGHRFRGRHRSTRAAQHPPKRKKARPQLWAGLREQIAACRDWPSHDRQTNEQLSSSNPAKRRKDKLRRQRNLGDHRTK
ncbi:NAD(P)-dependent oxidoreductase [Bradyrhizobium sp.]|uniref:NAD(P)-dependent oxidoreductase n=1 Tax=Bradyrhizobium sp. TaxID=376 RepID=UPI0025B8DD23|nr:NAD(P)-dependent oxidoreductase [Bradyrhizobium sp.]